jgi:hypothetical protein
MPSGLSPPLTDDAPCQKISTNVDSHRPALTWPPAETRARSVTAPGYEVMVFHSRYEDYGFRALLRVIRDGLRQHLKHNGDHQMQRTRLVRCHYRLQHSHGLDETMTLRKNLRHRAQPTKRVCASAAI